MRVPFTFCRRCSRKLKSLFYLCRGSSPRFTCVNVSLTRSDEEDSSDEDEEGGEGAVGWDGTARPSKKGKKGKKGRRGKVRWPGTDMSASTPDLYSSCSANSCPMQRPLTPSKVKAIQEEINRERAALQVQWVAL